MPLFRTRFCSSTIYMIISWRFKIIVTEQLVKNGTETIGVVILNLQGFFPYAYRFWIWVGALINFVLLLYFSITMALTYLDRECSLHFFLRFMFRESVVICHYSATVSLEKDCEDVIVSSRWGTCAGRAGTLGLKANFCNLIQVCLYVILLVLKHNSSQLQCCLEIYL